jgi:hypothetical protein
LKSSGVSLATFAARDTDRERLFDDDLKEGEVLEPICVGVFDEEQRQWTAIAHWKHKLRLSVEAFPDSFHRRSNDVWRGLSLSGMAVWTFLSLLCCNVAYGPWTKGKNFTELMEIAHDISIGVTADDPILIRLWGRICRDRQWTEDEQCSRQGRVIFLEGLLARNPARVKGPKCSPSKFFSIQRGWRFWRPDLHTRAFIIVCLIKEKQWTTCWEDLFTGSQSLRKFLAEPTTHDGPRCRWQLHVATCVQC